MKIWRKKTFTLTRTYLDLVKNMKYARLHCFQLKSVDSDDGQKPSHQIWNFVSSASRAYVLCRWCATPKPSSNQSQFDKFVLFHYNPIHLHPIFGVKTLSCFSVVFIYLFIFCLPFGFIAFSRATNKSFFICFLPWNLLSNGKL